MAAERTDDEALPALRTTSWAVLGLLSFGSELSGYDVKKWADWSLQFFFWSPSFSQIYTELRKLEELGYTASRVVSRNDARDKRLYSITEPGAAALARWANESVLEPVVLKHSVMLRMWLGHLGAPDSLRERLAAHRERAEKLRRYAEADAKGAATEPDWAFPELVLRWSERYYADERDRMDLMLAELDELLAAQSKRRAGGPAKPKPRSAGELRRRGH
ncbi:PadR family transcriptional regulator [Sciscionella marina]|uniref:PadR family transcriptional regulator n=1 Tax=Sciscionella marina TaxID=508770 RepID=UPI00037E6284|nr:PadR family transcriptional regulator [Sciscionella marina]